MDCFGGEGGYLIYTHDQTAGPLEIPEISVNDYALRHAKRLGDKAALIDGPSGNALSYADLHIQVGQAATGLAARGFRKGDVLAIYCPNVPEYAVVFNAVAQLGGINTTINPLYTARELLNQLNDASARFLVTTPLFLDKALEAVIESSVEEIFVLGEATGATPFSDLLGVGDSPPDVTINPRDDLVVLPYSSGTTGLPKGVMLTHHNLVANLCQFHGFESQPRLEENDIVLAVLPFFHIYGMVVVMKLALAHGATVVTMPRFDMADFLALIQRYRITTLPMVPPMVLGLAKSPLVDQYDLSSLRTLFCGAAPLGAELSIEAGNRVGCPVVQGYGMTEASPVTHLSPKNAKNGKPGSIGKVIPMTEVRIVDVDSGADQGPNAEGELWIRGPQIMRGYLNQATATADSIDENGWYRTGDIGYADEDGFFYIVDRVKELIKYKGLQVSPAELEALLLTHPEIIDAAVIPILDEEAGELPKAYVVTRTGDLDNEPLAAQIMAFMAELVSPHKRIRVIEFCSEIPKSASGKILRRVLVEQTRSGT
jgi:acyl-CoA synthetase (AMP-forming)/AMP-acid ligase II